MKNLQLRSQIGATVRMDDVQQDGKKIVGRAIVYNSLSRDLGGFVERFLPGAVADSVARGIVCALVNHDTSQPIGDQQAGTLRLIDGSAGLDCEITLPDTSYARDAVAVMQQRGGTGTGMSFGFNIDGPDDVAWLKENGQNVAEIRKAQLGEVSILTGMPPAYAATSAVLRSLDHQGEIDLAERYGVDLDQLAAVFTSIKRGLILSDAEQKTMQKARSLFAKVRRPLLEAAEDRASKVLLD
jgi:HK97 family phage prohead protease